MNNNSKALIIFARKPELGKVKTRLAATTGPEKALEIYIKLLKHTRQLAANLNCDKFVFLTEPTEDDFWKGFNIELQEGDSLGMRMQYAFKLLFDQHYKSVVIIGSDCFELTSSIIDMAFDTLLEKDVVLGPALDGGYYLLGMRQLLPKLFSGKQWSTENVFNDTLKDIKNFQHTYHILPVLNDIDFIEDVPKEWLADL